MKSHPPSCHLICEPSPADGDWNMALDAALLALAIDRAESVVRIYRWKVPTVTLGYFQASTTTLQQSNPFPDLPVVRRLSGGGAILHHHEWTYSCILPPHHPARKNPSQLYQTVHLALIELLVRCSAPCRLRGEPNHQSSTPSEETTAATEHFLCFLRGNPNDIIHDSGFKIVGSAQRRRQGAILQHGSILIRASNHTPDLPGLLDLSPSFDLQLFQTSLPDVIAGAVAESWQRRDWTDSELELARQIQRQTAIEQSQASNSSTTRDSSTPVNRVSSP
jgi:lipoyl(octanoyl) transferase